MNAPHKPFRVAFPDFESFLTQRPDEERWELHDGVMRMMTPPAERHQVIVDNVVSLLKAAVRGNRALPWRVRSGLGVRSTADRGSACVPDIVVRPRVPEVVNWCTDPLAVIEVLSPTTEAVDRGFKRLFYLSLPTLSHYVLIDSRELNVQHLSRADGFRGAEHTAADAVVALADLGVTLPLSEIYDETGLVAETP